MNNTTSELLAICRKTTPSMTFEDILKIALVESKHQAVLVFLVNKAILAKDTSVDFLLRGVKDFPDFKICDRDFEVFCSVCEKLGVGE